MDCFVVVLTCRFFDDIPFLARQYIGFCAVPGCGDNLSWVIFLFLVMEICHYREEKSSLSGLKIGLYLTVVDFL